MGMHSLLIKLAQILLGLTFMGDVSMPIFHSSWVSIGLYSPRYTSSALFTAIFSSSLIALLHITSISFISIVYLSIIY
jgi:hypothetical protein